MNTDMGFILHVLSILLASVESGKISKKDLQSCKADCAFLSEKYRAGMAAAEKKRFDREIASA